MALDTYTAPSAFFKPKDYTNALAILVEVESYNAAADNPFKDQKGEDETRPEVVATFSVFEDQAALDDGDPIVLESQTLAGYRSLSSGLGANVGKTLLLRLGEQPTKGGNAKRVWQPVTDKKIVTKVEEYLAALEEAPI